MRFLYLIALKNIQHIVFVVLFILSVIIIGNNNSPSMKVIRGFSIDFVSYLYKPIVQVKSLIMVDAENQYLRRKNIQLSLQLESMSKMLTTNERLLELLDFKRKTKYELIAARVVNKGIHNSYSSITLDVGRNDGVKINQPVLTPEGVIGKTVQVGNKATIVQSILDHNYRISVKIFPSGAMGLLKWDYDNLCVISEVQKNVEINIGNKVVTSGYSDIYPAGLPVAVVSGVYNERGTIHKTVFAEISDDIISIENAFLIIDSNYELD